MTWRTFPFPILLVAMVLTGEVMGEGERLWIRGGRVMDGTGSPWYRADLWIENGRIVRMGVGEEETAGVRVLEAEGLVVAPGFIDMMGQNATPLLEDPAAAINLLAQGITTINAGEGVSAAPLGSDEAGARGWATMGEYFQLLALRGMPLNVVQTVGHTQVRRLVMGEAHREPSAAEMEAMKVLVREGMEAGAIGLSTALIYPPAVYAGVEEIAALAGVAGRYGGRYFTHMRNEGGHLLEAMDEAMEIGRVAGTPVHIFHLKAAGEGNWPKMEAAIGKIREAREAGFQVTADMYPYVHNGLGLPAFIHPRHFAEGWEAFLAGLDGNEQGIREEMETEAEGWENWYQHVGKDWDRVLLGRTNHLRYQAWEGKSLGEAAEATGEDPWEVFFALVRSDAFVMPQSMSEENKRRLIKEPFISFCTDVGPYGGGGLGSHPRGFGALARVFSRYVREEGVLSWERAVAQASAAAANVILRYDRGRLAEGLAADVVVFSPETFGDRATFGSPHALAEGMRHVVVNGELVFTEGKWTGALPGKVLRGPGYRRGRAPEAVRTGQALSGFGGLDGVIAGFIEKHEVPGVAVAVTEGGRLVYSRGFGYADLGGGVPVTPESLFRIASISKPVTAAAIVALVEDGRLHLHDKVFALLSDYVAVEGSGERDPRLDEITVEHLLRHEGGWDRESSFDPMFRSVEFAEALGSPPPADVDEVIVNMLTQPLDFSPGERQAYSNFGYALLGRVIEEVSGRGYEDFVKARVLGPAGAGTMRLGGSLLEERVSGEVRYYSPHRGPSVFAENLGKLVPYPYGGWHLEAMDAHGAWLASAIDLARFAVGFDDPAAGPFLGAAAWDLMHGVREEVGGGARRFVLGWARWETPKGVRYTHSGALAGTSTVVVRRADGRNWVALFNALGGPRAERFADALFPLMEEALDAIVVDAGRAGADLFEHYPGHRPGNATALDSGGAGGSR